MELTTLLDRANLLLEQGRYHDAEKQIKQVLEQEPENDNALSILARCYFNSGQNDNGIEVIQQAIRIDPTESFYFYLLGFGFYQKDLNLPASDNLKKAIELYPYNAEYFGLLAIVYFDDKRYEETLQKANEGLALDPENITCLNIRARALNKLNRTQEAISTMENSLSQDPYNAFTHTTIGWNFFEKGDHRKANHHFRESLRIDPNYESARIGLKESLKSIFFPYKMVVQFSLWMSEKSKNFQWAFYIGMYALIRIFNNLAETDNTLRPFLLPVIVLYFVFIFFTWIANPVANFFLLFHKDGKYSLTRSESIIGVTVVVTLTAGILLATYAYYSFAEPPSEILFPAIILSSVSIPIAQLELPIHFKNATAKIWYPFLLVIAGLLAIGFYFINSEIALFITVIYGVALLIFTWVAMSWH